MMTEKNVLWLFLLMLNQHVAGFDEIFLSHVFGKQQAQNGRPDEMEDNHIG